MIAEMSDYMTNERTKLRMYVKANLKKKGVKNYERPCWALIYSVFIHWNASNWKRDARKHYFSLPCSWSSLQTNVPLINLPSLNLTHNRIILFLCKAC